MPAGALSKFLVKLLPMLVEASSSSFSSQKHGVFIQKFKVASFFQFMHFLVMSS